MSKPKVLVADPVSERGVSELQEGDLLEVVVKTGLKEDQLLEIIGEFDGLVVRSQTKVNAKVIDAAKRLKVVGRAGVGVDNVDVEAATKRGVVVMNKASALEAAKGGKFDILVSDIDLPDGTGHEIMEELGREGPAVRGSADS